MMIWCSKRFMA